MIGLDAIPRTRAVYEQGRSQGLHHGMQLFVSRDGQTLVDVALGDSRPGVAALPDSIMLWLSACKPIGAVALLQLAERGRCELNACVPQYIPEFAVGGKEAITLRHLLIHTGGFRWIDVGGPETPWHEIIGRICRAPIERGWVPGAKAGYHPYTSWYILGELIRRLDGRGFGQYVRDEVFLPLDMPDCWIGMPAEQIRAYGDRIGQMANTEKPGQPPHRWSQPDGIMHGAPGGGGHGPMRQLAHFYEMLLGGGQRQGVRLLSPASTTAMTARVREGMYDHTFRHTMDWGLGLIIDSKQYGVDTVPYGYGHHCSPRTFGHSGSQSSVAFADPDAGRIVCLVFNGMPGEARHQSRIREILDALDADLAEHR